MSATGATPSGRESSGYDRPTTGRDVGNDHGRRLATETKAAYKTTEFGAFLAVLAGVLIAGAVTSGGKGHDFFFSFQVWTLATILTVGYMLSRGLAKAGNKQPYDER
ncbi:MAG: hypothetical protein ACR2K9_01735 [Solirubrobacteraceae bacterium]